MSALEARRCAARKIHADILETEPPSASVSDEEFGKWRAQVRERAGLLIGEIRKEDEPDRKQIARQLQASPTASASGARTIGTKSQATPTSPTKDADLQSIAFLAPRAVGLRGLGWPTEGIIGQEFHDEVTGADGTIAFFALDAGLMLGLYERANLAKDARHRRSVGTARPGSPGLAEPAAADHDPRGDRAGTAAVAAAAVAAGTAGASRDTGIHTTAYVVQHAESALSEAVAANDIMYLRDTDGTQEIWFSSGLAGPVSRTEIFFVPGQLVWDIGTTSRRTP